MEVLMTKTRYTDNTNAADPPGGKTHNVKIDSADTLPPEQGRGKNTDRPAPNAKKSARPAR